MPRRYYKKRTVVVRPKKKWASNIKLINQGLNSSSPNPVYDLVVNSSETATPTPVIIKAGNFKIQSDLVITPTSGTASVGLYSAYAVVMYLPQGNNPTTQDEITTLVSNHPEWVIVIKQFDVPYMTSTSTAVSSTQLNASSRLKRNLNSGDKIIFAIFGVSLTSRNITINTTARYWTCAN